MKKQRCPIKRRHFLAGSSALVGSLGLNMSAWALPSSFRQQPLNTAVVGEMSCRVYSSLADFYRPPLTNCTTVDYVNGLSEEALLRKHPFC